jgi:hypothetical protein
MDAPDDMDRVELVEGPMVLVLRYTDSNPEEAEALNREV